MLHRRAFNHDTLIANSCGVSFGLRQGLLEKWLGQSILAFICLFYVLIENMYFLTLTFKKKLLLKLRAWAPMIFAMPS